MTPSATLWTSRAIHGVSAARRRPARYGLCMAHYSVQMSGKLFGDIWCCTLHMASAIPIPDWLRDEIPGPDDPDSVVQDIGRDIKAWWLRPISGISNAATLDLIKVAEIDPDSKKYVGDAREVVFTPGVQGTQDYAAPQNTIAISLLTGLRKGAAARGRIYPPTGDLAVQADGHLGEAQITAICQSAKQLLEDLGNAPGMDAGSLRVVVLGKGGVARKVTEVAVGNVADTQRRRRNALRESYVRLPVSS